MDLPIAHKQQLLVLTHTNLDRMVRSTTIFRVHDALPLAASVDDESVSISSSVSPSYPHRASLLLTCLPIDRKSFDRIQAAI